MEKNIIKNVEGQEFVVETAEEYEISPLEGGYIITDNGLFIPIKDNQDHSDVFSNYLSNFLNKTINVNTIDGMVELVKNGSAVYLGIKMGDVKRQDLSQSMGLLCFPPDIENRSSELREGIKLLIDKNKSVFGNREKIQIEYQALNPDGTSREYTKDELLDSISSTKSK